MTKVRLGMVEDGYLTSQLFRSIMVGMVADFPFVPVDPWWLPLFGQTVLTADYPLLAQKFGAVGANLVLPDYRGRVRAGLDNMGGTSANRLTNQAGGLNGDVLGASGGSETHTLTEPQMPAHSHGGSTGPGGAFAPKFSKLSSTAAAIATPGDPRYMLLDALLTNGYNQPVGIEPTPDHVHAITASGGGTAHNNVQPTIVAVACILAF